MKVTRYIPVIFTALFVFGCTHFDEPVEPVQDLQSEKATRSSVDAAALRASAGVASADNPYSLANMQKAYNQIAAATGTSARPLTATHEYVRFHPENEHELYILDDSLGLELFDYPTDRLLSEEEAEFYSNDLIDGYPWYYTVVPKGYTYPSEVACEVLQDVYLHDSEPLARTMSASGIKPFIIGGGSASSISESEYENILEQAMKNAGVEIESGASASGGAGAGVTITYDDYVLGEIPIERIIVRASAFLRCAEKETGPDGKATFSDKFLKSKKGVTYKLKFKNKYWRMIEDINGLAELTGYNKKGRWNYCITDEDDKASAYIAVHRALNYIYYSPDNKFKMPKRNYKLRVGVAWSRNSDNGDVGIYFIGRDHWLYSTFGEEPVMIYGKTSSGRDLGRREMLFTTLHELGHAIHGKITHHNHNSEDEPFGTSERTVNESFAQAVRYISAKKIYPTATISMIEGNTGSDSAYNGVGYSLYHQGFTEEQLISIYTTSKTWEEVKQKAMALYERPQVIEYMFDNTGEDFFFNLITELIVFDRESEIVYTDTWYNFEVNRLMPDAIKNNTRAAWSAGNSGLIEVAPASGGSFVRIKFKKPGDIPIFCHIKLDDEVTFVGRKTIQVTDMPSVEYTGQPRIGVPHIFRLSSNYESDQWLVDKYTSSGALDDPTSSVVDMNTDDPNTFKLMFFTPSEYQVKAAFIFNSETKFSSVRFTVPSEGVTTTFKKAPGIYTVPAYQNSAREINTFHIETNTVATIYPGEGRLSESSGYYFKTFSALPKTDHPYYSKLQPIYMHQYDNGKKALGKETLKAANGNAIASQRLQVQYYLLKTQEPGTVPIYDTEVTVSITTNTGGIGGIGGGSIAIPTSYRFISPQMKTGTTSWGNKKTTYTNLGIIGYAYPY